MKYAVTILLAAVLGSAGPVAQAQTRVYRCGSTYTNDIAEAQAKGCKPLEGGNVTVVQGTRVQGPTVRPTSTAPAGAGAAGAAGGQRVEAADQRARDTDARQILESELKKAETRQAELQKEYNAGEPERLGSERNYQKYIDRVAELKAALARNEADIAGIRRELARLGGSGSAGGGAASASK